VKFLCDSCKAKYQIADEKVAGKTVRMKCRKCGHQIEVRAAVTETSVSAAPPTAPDAPRAPAAAKNSLATSLSATKPRAPSAPSAGAGAAAGAGGGALAGAFQRTVQDGGSSAHGSSQPSAIELSVTDEWYVAINGVPVGPVRISELRRKAASGAVTEDSLCWQEGLEEWRPVRSVPELATIVREAAQGNRPSLISPPPADPRMSAPPRAPQRPAAPRAPEAARPSSPPAEPPRPFAAPSRSNVVPLRVAASSPSDEVAALASPLAGGASAALAPQIQTQPTPSPAPQISPAPPPPAPAPPAPVAVADPFAIPPAAPAVAPPAAPAAAAAVAAPAPPARRAGVPLWFWLVALFTVSFGGVAAYALFFRQPPPPAPVVITVPAAPTTPAADTHDIPPPPPSAEPTASASASATTKVAVGGPPKANSGGATPATPDKKTADLSGLLGGGGAGGPGVGPGSSPGGGNGGGLDSSSVERVVASHRAGVKRTCWERGGADQKSSVNVTVSATVGPAGNVVGTSSSGDDPVVAKCIENQVRSWMFSAPGSTTTVNIPFKFVRQ